MAKKERNRANEKSSILIVEDDDAMRTVLSEHLSEKYEVKSAASFQEAIELFSVARFHLAIVDIHLPDGNGISLMKNFLLDGSVAVVMMTSDPQAQTAIAALKSGAYDYIIKPFDLDDFDAVVRRGLDYAKTQVLTNKKRQITLRLDTPTVTYFKELSKETGMSYQNILNLYLRDCVNNKKKVEFEWEEEDSDEHLDQ